MPTLPPVPAFPIDQLPERLRTNWHIMTTLASDALVKYASQYADTACLGMRPGNERGAVWCKAFDAAAAHWSDLHSFDATWPWRADWPDGAARYPGAGALAEARSIVIGATEARSHGDA